MRIRKKVESKSSILVVDVGLLSLLLTYFTAFSSIPIVCLSGGKKCYFFGKFAYVLYGWSLGKEFWLEMG